MAEFNSDELVPPSFMTEAYIVDILRQVEDDPELHVRTTRWCVVQFFDLQV